MQHVAGGPQRCRRDRGAALGGGGRCGVWHCPGTMPCPMPPCDAPRGSSLGRWEPHSEATLPAEGPKSWARCLEVSEAGLPAHAIAPRAARCDAKAGSTAVPCGGGVVTLNAQGLDTHVLQSSCKVGRICTTTQMRRTKGQTVTWPHRKPRGTRARARRGRSREHEESDPAHQRRLVMRELCSDLLMARRGG